MRKSSELPTQPKTDNSIPIDSLEVSGSIPGQDSLISLDNPAYYSNRELSLLAFQRRVLEEAELSENPLLERMKFLAIFGSNMDEFFMVRVATLKQAAAQGALDLSIDGRSITAQLTTIQSKTSELFERAYSTLNVLTVMLADEGIEIVPYSKLSPDEKKSLRHFFRQTIFPTLTPLGYDPGRPFPHISSLSVNLAILVKDQLKTSRFARLKIPDSLPQLVALEQEQNQPKRRSREIRHRFVWLEEVVLANLADLFPGMDVIEAYPFRITRDAEIEIQEMESDDLLSTIEEAVWRRRFRSVVRLEVASGMPDHILNILLHNLPASRDDVYPLSGPLGLNRLWQLQNIDAPRLKFKPQIPWTPPELRPNAKDPLFSLIRRNDILLHHPFESFQPVVEFLRNAARDPDVLAIKMTLYRVGRNSPIVKALLKAIEEGKQVSVLVELKARFDEESNIEWARALESEGVHVVYGLVGVKVHSKLALVVRREGDAVRKYVHLGTGNYNPTTARLYTDLSFFTCDEQIGDDTVALFNRLTGYAEKSNFQKLIVAPFDLRSRLETLIQREIAISQNGGQGHLIFKINGLDDPGLIRLLYQASQAGVKIDLLVRGICCLRPGIPGVSENIRVVSIVGRFLEHSRIFYFGNDGEEEIYAGSADIMPRNLDRRIEVVFPILSQILIQRLKKEILETYLADNFNAREMQSDGTYIRRIPTDKEPLVDSQSMLANIRMG